MGLFVCVIAMALNITQAIDMPIFDHIYVYRTPCLSKEISHKIYNNNQLICNTYHIILVTLVIT